MTPRDIETPEREVDATIQSTPDDPSTNGDVASTFTEIAFDLPYHSWRRHLKRLFDVIVVIVSLPLLLPVMLLIGLVVVCSSPGNPFFGQRRVGLGNKHFICIKFRTMYPDAEARLHADPDLYERYVANDFKLAAADDPRVFPVGRFLRRTSLDELPQLLNVLKGHMSLVGPRPVVPAELELYGPWKADYLAARPGITGPWQVNADGDVRYPERAMIDAAYRAEWRFTTDIKILVKTIPMAVRRHRSY